MIFALNSQFIRYTPYTKEEKLFYLIVYLTIIALLAIVIIAFTAYDFWKKERKLIINFFTSFIFFALIFALIGELIEVRWKLNDNIYFTIILILSLAVGAFLTHAQVKIRNYKKHKKN